MQPYDLWEEIIEIMKYISDSLSTYNIGQEELLTFIHRTHTYLMSSGLCRYDEPRSYAEFIIFIRVTGYEFSTQVSSNINWVHI